MGSFTFRFLLRMLEYIYEIRIIVYKVLYLIATFSLVIWLSIFMYGMFYYLYIPPVSIVKPVYLQFETTCDKGICSFPSADIPLVRYGQDQALVRGQPYRIVLQLEMPESVVNRQLGMFMVKLDMMSRNGEVVKSSYRSAMLHYKSTLLRMIHTLIYAPLLLSGAAEEKQILDVPLFENYEENPEVPAVSAYIQVRSRHVEIYAASLHIHAYFTGLRYFMFHWPILSSVVGVSTNLFFLSIIAICSWYRFLFQPKENHVVFLMEDNGESLLEARREQAKNRLIMEREQSGIRPTKESLSQQEPEESENILDAAQVENIGPHFISAANLRSTTSEQSHGFQVSEDASASCQITEPNFEVVGRSELALHDDFEGLDPMETSLQLEGDEHLSYLRKRHPIQ